MKNRLLALLIAGLFLPLYLPATNVKFEKVELYQDFGELYAVVNISWDNAWRNGRNHDAVWLFTKFLRGDEGYIHGYLTPEGHHVDQVEGPAGLIVETAPDSTGLFLFSADAYRGPVRATLRLRLDRQRLGNAQIFYLNFRVYGLEMVYIPAGGFTLGDPDTAALAFGAFYRSGPGGRPDGLYRIEKEDQVVEVGPEPGKLYYRSGREHYEGDQQGPVPAGFPKGAKAFYIMKYEVTQGQYADFLNSLSASQTQYRVIFGHKQYYTYRGTLRWDGKAYVADRPDRPLNFAGWDDGLAFADWAGLRPMTELEFTKACRGPRNPEPREYPWGSQSKSLIQRVVSPEGDLILLGNLNEQTLNDGNRHLFGASYYWVMDLAGSIWERVITIGDSTGRAFTGTHGDGRLTGYGFANAIGWPSGSVETAGFGFRGGGFYAYGRGYGEFNPYSPVAYRRFGGWSGGVRAEAYGQRFVRTR